MRTFISYPVNKAIRTQIVEHITNQDQVQVLRQMHTRFGSRGTGKHVYRQLAQRPAKRLHNRLWRGN